MPRPVGIGALVTINHWRRRGMNEEDTGLDDTVANFCTRPFAKLDTGDVVFVPPPGPGLGLPRAELVEMDPDAFSAFVAANVAMRAPASLERDHGHVYMRRWEQLSAALREEGVIAHAAELIALPFETITDAEVRDLMR